MREKQSLAPVSRAWWNSVLDGPHAWGSFDAMVSRHDVRRYRLIVFPPGISVLGRRLLRLSRGWPLGGVTVTMLAVMLVPDTLASPTTTLAIGTATYVSVWIVLFAVTAELRAGVRTMSLILLTDNLNERDRQRYAEWELLVNLLTRADSELKSAAIDATQHEALWWQAYDRLKGGIHV